ncbi:hypothetical protein PanWU01x14_258940, partial [Parasponia andersonii]
AVHPKHHRPPSCQTHPSTVSGRCRRASAEYCRREPPFLAGEIAARSSRHRIRKMATVLPSHVRSPHHHHHWIRLNSSFHFRPLSASNSAPVRS